MTILLTLNTSWWYKVALTLVASPSSVVIKDSSLQSIDELRGAITAVVDDGLDKDILTAKFLPSE